MVRRGIVCPRVPDWDRPVRALADFLSRWIGTAITAAALLLIGMLWIATAYVVGTDRAEHIDAAYGANANLARAFEEHTARTLFSVDQVVLFIKYLAERPGPKVDMEVLVRNGFNLRGSSLIENVGVIDEHGDTVWASKPFIPFNAAEQEHFKVHIEKDSHQLYVGKPVIGGITGTWSIAMTRRITRPDGTFGGVVYASVDPLYFANFYQQVDLGSLGVVIVVGRDGIVRARQTGNDTSVGQDIGQTDLIRHASEREAGSYATASVIDDIPRFFSYRAVGGYPFIVGVGTAESQVLAEHYVRRSRYYGAASLVSAAILLFAALMIVTILWRRREAVDHLRADLALRESEAHRASIVDSARDAIVSIDDQQRIVVFNRAAEQIFRCPASEAIGHSIDRFIPERARQVHRAHVENFTVTGGSARDITGLTPLPALRSDGEEFSAEVSISTDTRGGQRYRTAIVRDVSGRQRAERQIQRLTNMYQALGETNEAIVKLKDRSALFDEVVAIVTRYGGFDLAKIWIRDHGTPLLRTVARAGRSDQVANLETPTLDLDSTAGSGPTRIAYLGNRPEICHNAGTAPAAWQVDESCAGYQFCAALPLCEAGRAVGTLSLYATESERFDKDAIELLSRIAASVSLALETFNHDVERAAAEATLRASQRFAQSTIDALENNIAVIADSGRILAVNKAWREFGAANGADLASTTEGANYLDVCDKAGTAGDADAAEAAKLIRAVLRGEHETATLEYSCHSPNTRRWFMMNVSRFAGDGPLRIVVNHQNVTERRLREEELYRFRVAMDSSADAIFLFDIASWRFVDCNDAYCQLLGYTRDEVLEKLSPEQVLAVSREDIHRNFEAMTAGETDAFPSETVCRHKDGTQVPVDVQRRAVLLLGGWIIVGVMRDISARLDAQNVILTNALQQGLIAALGRRALIRGKIDELLDQAGDVIAEGLVVGFFEVQELSPDGTSLTRAAGAGWENDWMSRRVTRLSLGSPEQFALEARQPVLVEDFRQETRFAPSEIQVAHGIRSGVLVPIGGLDGPYGLLGAYSRNARQFPPESADFLQGVANILAAAIDRTKSEDEMAYRAQFDKLTDLPNRNLFRDRIAQAMLHASGRNANVGVVTLDLDRFKTINDAYGHAAGDRLIVQVARRLESHIGKGDSVGYLDGNQFGLVLSEVANMDDINLALQTTTAALATPFDLDGQEIHLTACFGIAVYPVDGVDSEVLLKNASSAMSRAKEQGHGTVQFFTEALNVRAAHMAALTQELRGAIRQQEFELHYQPQVSLHNGRVVGAEALIRWRHPERGLVAPGEFIGLAEETGLIVPIGEWVLGTACAQAASWQRAGREGLSVSVNVSAVQLRHGGFAASVRAALEASGLEPSRLELELTESGIMQDTERFIEEMSALRALGVSIAIDDFGTGYSSLSYLKRLPVDTLKIDQSFIRNIIVEPNDAAITRAIIAMASLLKLRVVAEGVETEEQKNFLRRSRCDIVQGYLFGAAVPAAGLDEMLDGKGFEPLLPAPSEATRSLLLVDDEPNNLRALKRVFRHEGYQVHTAESAREAFEILANVPISVIVSDQRMPEMSGTEFLSRVKSIYPDTVRIVLSGYTDLATVTGAINEGAIYKFLTKPWDDEALRRDIRQAFQMHLDQSLPE